MRGAIQWLRSFSAELRRRGVYRVGGVYLASAYVVLQVADLTLPALALPDWVLTFLVLAALTGFPVALSLAWLFDVTSQRPPPAPEAEGVAGAGPALAWAFAALVIASSLALGAATWWVWLGPAASRGDAGPATAGDAAPSPARIAVLYFDDHSPDRTLGYLADGLTEGLIHELSQVEGLEVVSRNGVKAFREAGTAGDSLLRALGVGSVVEGSVVRSGDRVKLTVQLIDGVSGVHLESRVLERDWGELFALQDSLTEEVARGLRSRLGQELRRRATRNRASSVEAWSLLQEATSLQDDYRDFRTRDSTAAIRALLRGDSLLSAAERLDPTWVDLAVKRGWIASDLSRAVGDPLPGGSDATWASRALGHAERAIALAPEHPGGYEIRGTVRAGQAAREAHDKAASLRAGAEADLRRALELDARDATAWWALSRLLLDQGRFMEAARAAREAFDADAFLEVAATAVHELYYSAINLEEFAEARRWCDEGRRRFPANSSFIVCQLFLLASAPDVPPDAGRAWRLADSLEAAVAVRNRDRFRAYGRMQVAKVLARAERPDSARAVMALARGDEAPDWLTYDEAHARLLLGERDEALRLLARYVEFDPSARDFLAGDWWFRPLWEDPDFKALLTPR